MSERTAKIKELMYEGYVYTPFKHPMCELAEYYWMKYIYEVQAGRVELLIDTEQIIIDDTPSTTTIIRKPGNFNAETGLVIDGDERLRGVLVTEKHRDSIPMRTFYARSIYTLGNDYILMYREKEFGQKLKRLSGLEFNIADNNFTLLVILSLFELIGIKVGEDFDANIIAYSREVLDKASG